MLKISLAKVLGVLGSVIISTSSINLLSIGFNSRAIPFSPPVSSPLFISPVCLIFYLASTSFYKGKSGKWRRGRRGKEGEREALRGRSFILGPRGVYWAIKGMWKGREGNGKVEWILEGNEREE